LSDTTEFIHEDIRAELPPRARNLIEAARRLLIQEGYEGLSWNRIATEAGEQKSIIGYYFGDKSTLVFTLLRLMGQDASERLVEQCESLPQGVDRLHTFLSGLRCLHSRPDSLAFYDVLPHALRDDRMRLQVAELYDWYRQTNLRVLGVDGMGGRPDGPTTDEDAGGPATASTPNVPGDPYLDAVAWLCIAAVDGIMIQEALNPPGYDSAAVHSRLEEALLHLLGVWAKG
jgi:AcrR family transcriptional regulator